MKWSLSGSFACSFFTLTAVQVCKLLLLLLKHFRFKRFLITFRFFRDLDPER